jgi:hypothetical protein
MPSQSGASSEQNYTWFMDTQNEEDMLHVFVDDFAIKHTSMEDAQHLIDTLKQDYTITIDWDATKYIRLALEWDYKNQKVYAHMPGYI